MPVPSGALFLGVAHELTRGTFRAATDFVPIDAGANSPNDMPHTAPDTNMRGSAVDSYDEVATQIWAEPDFAGNVFIDSFPFFLKSLLGDETSQGATGGTTSTLSADAVVGDTSVQIVADPGAATNITFQGGVAAAELRTITSKSGAGPYTVNFALPLERAHASASGVAFGSPAPMLHKFAALNSGNFQPPSLSLSTFIGDTTKGIPGCLVSEVGLKWTATGLLTWTAKLVGFQSADQSKPTVSFGSERAKPAYSSITTLGGTPITNNSEGDLTIARKVEPVPSCSGVQDPYAVWGGNVSVKGKITLIYEAAVFASEYPKLKASTATTLDLNWTNAGATTALRTLETQMSKVLYTAGKPTWGKSFVELPLEFEAVANTTDIGASAGYSPILVIVNNARGNAY